MESMKRNWGKPGLDVQVFVPNEYIAACGPDTIYVTYEFWCNAGGGTTFNVYLDPNGDGILSDEEKRHQYIGNFYACNESHSVTVLKGQSIDQIFPRGIIGRTKFWSGEYVTTPVRIWRGDDGEDIHCTTHLNETEFKEKNPS